MVRTEKQKGVQKDYPGNTAQKSIQTLLALSI